MSLWILLVGMIALACAGLAVALLRRPPAALARLGDSEALRLELAEIETQSASGALPRSTAEGLRAQTIRRYLDEGPTDRAGRPLSRPALKVLAAAVAATIALGATLLYARLGRPDLADPVVAQLAPGQIGESGAEPVELATMITRLEAELRHAPRDVAALRLLGAAFMQAGRYGDSAAAYGRAATLAPLDADSHSAQGEALTKVAGGEVTPAARSAFTAALAANPADPRARYFLAAYKDQQGDHAAAMTDWIALLRSAPPGAPWAPQVRAFVEDVAAQRHEDISGRIPAAAAQAAPDLASQKAMILGMVERLAARLKAQPRDPDGWINLMRARMVLADPVAAHQAYDGAMAAYSGDSAEQAQLTTAARRLGVQ